MSLERMVPDSEEWTVRR